MELIDVARLGNAILAAGVLGFWIIFCKVRWGRLTRTERGVFVGVGFLSMSIAYLAGGAISDTIPPVVRALLMAAPLGFLLAALAWDNSHRSN